jgi:uncharacterized protein (TIGR04255 family)
MVTNQEIPAPRDLVNKPLAEAIVEIRWALQPFDQGGGMQAIQVNFPPAPPGQSPQPLSDPAFKILVGLFYNRINQKYPYSVDLPAAQMPEFLSPYVVRHQFRASPEGWPRLQLGPGTLTVNQTSAGYSWSEFRKELVYAAAALHQCYPKTIALLKPTIVLFRYVNTIPFDYKRESITDFLSTHLHTIIQLDQNLFEDPADAGKADSLILRLSLPVRTPRGVLTLSFATGLKDQEPVVVWELILQTEGEHAPQNISAFEVWIDAAHAALERWFFTLCRGKLLELFEERHGNHQN